MDVNQFDFELPPSCIALRPARPRHASRLLQVKDGELSDHVFTDLPTLLKAGDVLVLNETKVLPASLSGVRPARAHGGGGDVEIDFNLHKQEGQDVWRAFARPAKRLKPGDRVHFGERLYAEVTDKLDGGDVGLHFNLAGAELQQAIEERGQMPLPPYIARKRAVDAKDVEDYQTLFARETGSVAAPTAGLHFTPDVFAALQAAGVKLARLTLHVGAGTFLPVSVKDTKDHKMHSEWYSISEPTADIINTAKKQGGRVICVGTTALRAVESASNQNGHLKAGTAETSIFITPGYRFRLADGVVSNFHLPKSTLFMLVSSLSGLDTMKTAYQHAIASGYRFYSYGDTSLLWKNITND